MAFCFGPTNVTATDYFFHCPRTGGNYTLRVINKLTFNGEPIFRKHRGHMHCAPPGLKHGTGGIKRSFTIVRPPLDWYRSFYRFRLTKHFIGRNMAPGHPLDKYIWEGQYQNGGQILPFDHFVRSVQQEYPKGYLTALFSRFMDHVDMVLSTDGITIQLPSLLASWGYDEPIKLPPGRRNSTVDRHGNWTPPKKFKRWAHKVQAKDRVRELPVDIEHSTVNLMERKEARIIERLRRIGI
jgi:hypothetical protein